jgi:hypothetical protein
MCGLKVSAGDKECMTPIHCVKIRVPRYLAADTCKYVIICKPPCARKLSEEMQCMIHSPTITASSHHISQPVFA